MVYPKEVRLVVTHQDTFLSLLHFPEKIVISEQMEVNREENKENSEKWSVNSKLFTLSNKQSSKKN